MNIYTLKQVLFIVRVGKLKCSQNLWCLKLPWNVKLTSIECNAGRMEDMCFFSLRYVFLQFTVKSKGIQQKSGFCSIFGKSIAEHCHFSLSEGHCDTKRS